MFVNKFSAATATISTISGSLKPGMRIAAIVFAVDIAAVLRDLDREAQRRGRLRIAGLALAIQLDLLGADLRQVQRQVVVRR